MKFSDVIGQASLKAQLLRSVEAGRISHAQLFTGQAGYGVLPMALAYVQYLNCPNRTATDSCGECPSCRQIAELQHPDLHLVMPVNKQGKKSSEVVTSDEFMPLWRTEIKRSSGYLAPSEWYKALDLGKTLKGAISAKEADNIVEKLALKSYGSGYKMMIIWLPEMMNESAANKILKILEEPWERTLFILISERPDKLLPTIISRTQEVAVARIEESALILEAQRQGVERQRAEKIARFACGNLLSMNDIIAGRSSDEQMANFEMFCTLMRQSYNDKHLELVAWAAEVARLTRASQLSLLNDSARLLREAYIRHAGLSQISYIWGAEQEFCNKFAPFIGSQNIEPLIAQVESATRQIAQNGNPTVVFTHFALAVSKMINRLK